MAVAAFTWIRSLGSGSSSHISLMRDDSVDHDDDTVILKTPKPDRTGETVSRVRQEARILATLRHRYIVAYKGQMMRPFWGLLVRFCPKGSLRDRVRWHQVHGTAMPESIIRKVLWQSLLALHHLHTAIDDRPGVVHRALSPEKLLFDEDGNVLLAGFGCAAHHPARGRFLQGMIADPTYAAPETCLGRRYGPLVDIYALGCIAFECCTLRSPYLMDLTEEANRDRANTLPTAYSLDLRTTIAFLLELDPAKRPTASHLLAITAVASCFDRQGRLGGN